MEVIVIYSAIWLVSDFLQTHPFPLGGGSAKPGHTAWWAWRRLDSEPICSLARGVCAVHPWFQCTQKPMAWSHFPQPSCFRVVRFPRRCSRWQSVWWMVEPAPLHKTCGDSERQISQRTHAGGHGSMSICLRKNVSCHQVLLISWSLAFALIGALHVHTSWASLNRSYLANKVATLIPTICSSI